MELAEIAEALDMERKGGEGVRVSGLSNWMTREVPLTKTEQAQGRLGGEIKTSALNTKSRVAC